MRLTHKKDYFWRIREREDYRYGEITVRGLPEHKWEFSAIITTNPTLLSRGQEGMASYELLVRKPTLDVGFVYRGDHSVKELEGPSCCLAGVCPTLEDAQSQVDALIRDLHPVTEKDWGFVPRVVT